MYSLNQIKLAMQVVAELRDAGSPIHEMGNDATVIGVIDYFAAGASVDFMYLSAQYLHSVRQIAEMMMMEVSVR